jgi:hypothetical protein
MSNCRLIKVTACAGRRLADDFPQKEEGNKEQGAERHQAATCSQFGTTFLEGLPPFYLIPFFLLRESMVHAETAGTGLGLDRADDA